MKRFVLPVCAFILAFTVGAVFTGDPAQPVLAPDSQPVMPIERVEPAATPAFAAASTAARNLARNATIRDFAEIAKLVDQLSAAQIAGLMDEMEKTEEHPSSLYQWWLARDPAAASAWIQPRLRRLLQDGPLGMTFNSGFGQIVSLWVRALPQEAMEFARQNPQSDLSAFLVAEALRWKPPKEQDFPATQAMLTEFPAGSARYAGMKTNLEGWAQGAPTAALSAAQAVADPRERAKLIRAVFEYWPGKEMAAALERYRQLDLRDPDILAGILRKTAEKDPAGALRFLEQLEEEEVAQAAPEILHSWAANEPVAALQWARDHNVSLAVRSSPIESRIEHNSLGRQGSQFGGRESDPLQSALKKDAAATVQWIRGLPSEERGRLAEQALPHLNISQRLELFPELSPDRQARSMYYMVNGFKEPEKARDWIATVPAGTLREKAWYAYGSAQPELADLPPGPERDAMLHGRSNSSGMRAVETDLGFVIQMSDSPRKREAFDQLMYMYTETFPYHADRTFKFLETAAFPEEWKNEWRARRPASNQR